MVGYIEEEDDIDSDSIHEGGAASGTELEPSRRSYSRSRRLASRVGFDSGRSERRSSSHSAYRSSSVGHLAVGGERSVRPGRLTFGPVPGSFGHDVNITRRTPVEEEHKVTVFDPIGHSDRVGRGGEDSRGGHGGGRGGGEGGGFLINRGRAAISEQSKSSDTDGTTDEEQQRLPRVSVRKKKKKNKGPGGVAEVGAAMTLTTEASAIVNAKSPAPNEAMESSLTTKGHDEEGEMPDFTPELALEVTAPLAPWSAPPVSPVLGWTQEKPPVMRTTSSDRPVALDHPVTRNTGSLSSRKVYFVAGCTSGGRHGLGMKNQRRLIATLTPLVHLCLIAQAIKA